MKSNDAVTALAALAQESRLALFRLLVRRGPEGYSAGELGSHLDIPAPTLSFHLKALSHAGLVEGRKAGRFVHYSANFELMSSLVSFLSEHCCSLATDCTTGDCMQPPATRRRRLA